MYWHYAKCFLCLNLIDYNSFCCIFYMNKLNHRRLSDMPKVTHQYNLNTGCPALTQHKGRLSEVDCA